MSTTATEYGNVSVLAVKGELTVETVEAFTHKASQCTSQSHFDLIVDCSSLTQVDSAGLEALVDVLKTCEDELGVVKLCAVDDTLAKILEITRLDRRFEVFDDLESAVQSFS